MHPSKERTLVLIKPDGIQRSLVGEIIKRYENVGLKLVGMKMIVPTEAHIETHYTLDPNWRRVTGEKTIKGYKDKGLTPPSEDPLEITAKILANLKKYLTAGPVVAMVWQGAHSVKIVRKITGGTEPLTSDVGTIRGDFVSDVRSRQSRSPQSHPCIGLRGRSGGGNQTLVCGKRTHELSHDP